MTDETRMDAGGGLAVAPTAPDATGFFGHPRGLATLFFTEMWERFSYYGMRAILILFMTAMSAEQYAAARAADPSLAEPSLPFGLGLDVAQAGAIYGLYTAFVYLAALPGGWLADRIFGTRRAVLIGGIIIASGHFSLAIHSLTTFYLGLALIVVGTGLLKPNISAIVGDLYPEGGARRDAGFSIFYMGINIGAFVAPLICGFLGEKVDWHMGFAAAGVGMVAGLIQYVLGGKYLGDAGLYSAASAGAAARAREVRRVLLAGVGGILLMLALVALHGSGVLTVTMQGVANAGGVIITSLALLYFTYMFLAGGLDAVERKRVVVIAVLFLFSAIFWSGFEQAGSSLNLVAERLTDRDVLGWVMPASWLQSVNPLFIITLAPVFAWLWVALAARNREPSSPAKFALGLILLGAGFLVLVWATMLAAGGQQVSPLWLVVTYFFHTTGELCLSPVGLSTVTKLAPKRMVGQMMGIWFMSLSLGNLMAGQVAGLFERLPLPQLFGAVVLTTAGSGLVLALFVRPIRRLMSGVH